MIEFVNYPPETADDVKLSYVGRETLKECISIGISSLELIAVNTGNTEQAEHTLKRSLYDMGWAVGSVIASAFPERCDYESQGLALSLAANLATDYQENVVADPESFDEFPDGIRSSVREAFEIRRLGSEAVKV